MALFGVFGLAPCELFTLLAIVIFVCAVSALIRSAIKKGALEAGGNSNVVGMQKPGGAPVQFAMPVETVRFSCPHCGKVFEAVPENAGQKFECPCGQRLEIPAPATKKTVLGKIEPGPLVTPVSTGSPLPNLNKLRRSLNNRCLAGVCGGLAEYTSSPAWIWRAGFLVMGLLWGVGLVLYIVLALLMPYPQSEGRSP